MSESIGFVMIRKFIGLLSLSCYRFALRSKAKLFSLFVSGGFAKFGKKSIIVNPIRLSGEGRIEIGDRVYVGSGSWLQTLGDGDNKSPAISIGDGTSIAGLTVISAVSNVIIENDVLIARNVYISDHMHKHTDINLPILRQGLDKIAPVLVRRGAWIGQNVVVCPGVTVGTGSVIGANSVVNTDIPDYCLAVGAPARVIREIHSVEKAKKVS